MDLNEVDELYILNSYQVDRIYITVFFSYYFFTRV